MDDAPSNSSDPGRWISVGGPVDSSRVSLCLYGRNLDPDAVTSAVGLQPTQAHRAGERITSRHENVYRDGAWILDVEGTESSPNEPEAALKRLFSEVRATPEVWSHLKVEKVRIAISLVVKDWNRGFSLSPSMLRRLADFSSEEIDFEIWFEPPVEGENDR